MSGRRGSRKARAQGKRNERRTAEIVGGHVHVGQDGDVVAYDSQGRRWMFECKSRQGFALSRTDELWHFLDQVSRYVDERWGPDMLWAIELYGGRKASFPSLSAHGRFFLVPDWIFLKLAGLGDGNLKPKKAKRKETRDHGRP